MAPISGSLNPSAAALLARTTQEPGRGPGKNAEGTKNGAPVSREGVQHSKDPEKLSEGEGAAHADGAAAEKAEPGPLKEGPNRFKNLQRADAHQVKDAFSGGTVAGAKQVQQVGAITQGTLRAGLRQRETGAPLKSQASTVSSRAFADTVDDLALLDMSQELHGQHVDLTTLTDDSSIS